MVESFNGKENLKIPYSLMVTTGFTNTSLFSTTEHLPVLTESLIKEANRRLPNGFTTSENIGKVTSKETDVSLEMQESENPSLEFFSERQFRLSGPLGNSDFVKQIPYIAYNCSEKIRQERMGLTSLHGVSLVSPDNQGILVLGDKGSGKTALSMALAMYKGYRLLANDLALLQNDRKTLSLVTGSKVMDIRLGVILHYFPDLKKYVSNEVGKNLYESKISVTPEDINVSSITGNFPLACIIRVNVHPFNDDIQIERGAKKKEQLRLYENLSRYIKGVTTPLILAKNGPLGVFPSMDNEDLGRRRNILTQKMLDFPNFFYFSSNNPITASSSIENLLKTI